MSASYNKKRKAAKASRTPYQKEIARKIKQGILPAFHLVTDGNGRLERDLAPKNPRKKPSITLRQQGTMATLTKEQYAEPAPLDMQEESTNESAT